MKSRNPELLDLVVGLKSLFDADVEVINVGTAVCMGGKQQWLNRSLRQR